MLNKKADQIQAEQYGGAVSADQIQAEQYGEAGSAEQDCGSGSADLDHANST